MLAPINNNGVAANEGANMLTDVSGNEKSEQDVERVISRFLNCSDNSCLTKINKICLLMVGHAHLVVE